MKNETNIEIPFGKKEFLDLMIPMAIFILIVVIATCCVAIYEACVL